MAEISDSPAARIVLRGHGSLPAEVEVVEYPKLMWLLRTLGYILLWLLWTFATLLFTVDPFIASFPFVVGLALVYKSWKGRYHVHSFCAHCPRCKNPLDLKPGSKIDLPHHMVCYSCHHEPELVIG